MEPGQDWKIAALTLNLLCAPLLLRCNVDEYYMNIALKEAKKAEKKGEIPIGAIIVCGDKIISKGHNTKEKRKCAVFHAEINAIVQASKKISNWRLNECVMYVTFEPCHMCMSAIKQSRIKTVIYGASNSMKVSNLNLKIINNPDSNSFVKLVPNVCKDPCEKLLKDFFKNQRN